MRMFRGGEGGENHLWRRRREYGREIKTPNSHQPFGENKREGKKKKKKKEWAETTAIVAREHSTEAGGKSRVDPGRVRGEVDWPRNKFPGRNGSRSG